MVLVTAAEVKKLREQTGAGMMDCKRALQDTNGDFEKAVEILRQKGLSAAAKRADRVAAEGVIAAFVSDNERVGALIELNCETDFVAKNEDFQQFANTAARQVVECNPLHLSKEAAQAEGITATDDQCLFTQAFVGNPEYTVEEEVLNLNATIGEKIRLRRFVRYEVPEGEHGLVHSYIHGIGRIGTLVRVRLDSPDRVGDQVVAEVVHDLAMQVAAARPDFVTRDQVPSELVEKEKNILRAQPDAQGKPDNIVERIVEGRMSKFYEQTCLVDQVFIKDQDISVSDYVQEAMSRVGGKLEIVEFVRFEVGEGLGAEKEEEEE